MTYTIHLHALRWSSQWDDGHEDRATAIRAATDAYLSRDGRVEVQVRDNTPDGRFFDIVTTLAPREEQGRAESPAETLRDIAARHEHGDLADPLAAFDEAMDAWRALDAGSVHHRPRVVAADPGHEFVTFRWSTAHGPCFECDAPAAWLLWCYGEDHAPAKACAVCACNHAAESGTRIQHIDPEEDED